MWVLLHSEWQSRADDMQRYPGEGLEKDTEGMMRKAVCSHMELFLSGMYQHLWYYPGMCQGDWTSHISWDVAIPCNPSGKMDHKTLIFRCGELLEDVQNIAKPDKIKQMSGIGGRCWKLPRQNGRLFLKNDVFHSWPHDTPFEPGGKQWCQSNRHAQKRVSKFLFYIEWC